MKKYFLLAALIFSILLSCDDENTNSSTVEVQKKSFNNKSNNDTIIYSTQRFGMVTGLKADKIEYYKKLHADVWPDVLRKIKDCNIQNYSIYLQKINHNYFLFSYFEYVGKDFTADMKKMAADSATQQWWKETTPTQIPLPETVAKNETWTAMEEVFHSN